MDFVPIFIFTVDHTSDVFSTSGHRGILRGRRSNKSSFPPVIRIE